MRIAYADPPYPGCAHLYRDHADYAGEVDHAALVAETLSAYDAWILHTASTTLAAVLGVCPPGIRVGAWVKTFAAFKRGVNPGYAWEPVIFHGCRNDSTRAAATLVDWIACPITLRRGLTGAKPDAVVTWALRMIGTRSTDTVDDLFPGTGAVTRAWESMRDQPELATTLDAQEAMR